MEEAVAAVSNFTSNRGHKTNVNEIIWPGVTRETIQPTRHEEFTQAIDREVHQHHYHTTVQPLSHQETLPAKHTHNILPKELHEFLHDDEQATQQRVAAQLARFKSSSVVELTRRTQATAPTVTGEHVHHHVHETVIPIVLKETIQPEIVHTTVPIHETHHAPALHHGISTLPMKTLEEFTKAGGSLTGTAQPTHETYDGKPREYNAKFATTFEQLGFGVDKRHHHADSGVGFDDGHYDDSTGASHPARPGSVVSSTSSSGSSGSSSAGSRASKRGGVDRRRERTARSGGMLGWLNPLRKSSTATTGTAH